MAADIKNSSFATGLVSFWLFNELSGVRYDAHGDNDLDDINTVLNGTLDGDVAADFEAANSERFSIQDADQTGLSIGGDISIFAICNLESVPTGGSEMWIANKYQGSGTRTGYGLGFDSNPLNFHFRAATAGNSFSQAQSAGYSYTTGVTYRVLAMLDVSASEVTFYVNGSLLSTNSMSASMGGGIGTGANEFVVGGQSNNTSETFDGLMKKVGIWNRLLTSDEAEDITGNDIPYEATASGIFIPKTTMI